MKTKLLCFPLLIVCAAALCGRYVRSTKADSARPVLLARETTMKKLAGRQASRVGRSEARLSRPTPTLMASANTPAGDAAPAITPPRGRPAEGHPGMPTPGPVVPIPDPPESRYDRWTCDNEYREANGDPRAIRDLMAKHLEEAGKYLLRHMLGSPRPIMPVKDLPRQRRRAMGICLSAADWASNVLGDVELADSICDNYLLPNLDAAAPERWQCLSQETVLSTVTSARQMGGDIEGAIDLYEWWIPRDPSRLNADANRIRLARQLDSQGRYEEAIAWLRDIDDKGDCAGARMMIPELEKKLREQRAGNGSGNTSAGGQR